METFPLLCIHFIIGSVSPQSTSQILSVNAVNNTKLFDELIELTILYMFNIIQRKVTPPSMTKFVPVTQQDESESK